MITEGYGHPPSDSPGRPFSPGHGTHPQLFGLTFHEIFYNISIAFLLWVLIRAAYVHEI
jgi:hypothetical protein